jgi:hypothetical protein
MQQRTSSNQPREKKKTEGGASSHFSMMAAAQKDAQPFIIGRLEDPYVEDCLAKIHKDKAKGQKFKEFVEYYMFTK